MSLLVALALTMAAVTHTDTVLHAEDGRAVAVRIYSPARGCRRCTLVIFSHGNFATPGRYDVLLDDWAAHGLVVAAPLHTDSEEYPDKGKYPDSRATRLADWRAVDHAMRGSPIKGVTLSGRVIAAGHSYGGLIAEIVGGARPVDGEPKRDWRVPAAVIAISPPGAMANFVTAEGFAAIQRPTLVVTGTADVLPGFIDKWQQHLDSYHGAPAGTAYALTFEGMNHYFNGAYGRPKPEGAAAMPKVAALNALIRDFIHAAVRGRMPSITAWAAKSSADIRAEAR
jgi:alpha-beta hydrolase superfamily lysophospholipase